MKKDTQAKKWLWGTLLVGAAAVILLIWAGNVVLYPTYMHWRGRPTAADKAELYAFAEKLGYEPENEVDQSANCNGWGSAKSCSINLYFLETQTIDEKYINERIGLSLARTVIREPRSVPVRMVLSSARGIEIDGYSYPHNHGGISGLRVNTIGFRVRDDETHDVWGVTIVETHKLTETVRLNGELTTQNIVKIARSYRCSDQWLGICE